MIRIVEGRRVRSNVASSKSHFGEALLPDQLRELMQVFARNRLGRGRWRNSIGTTIAAQRRRQRLLARFLAADQIAADRDERLAALRPQRGHDVGRARSPIKAGDDAFWIWSASISAIMSTRDRRLLAIARAFRSKETRRSVAAQVGHDHPVARRRQQGRDIDEAVDVVWPAVQQDHRRPSAGPASAYPTFSTPASICLSGPKDAPARAAGWFGAPASPAPTGPPLARPQQAP